ncbi:hypothetical protein [Modestobacter sp. Leaf380]|uniref:hypothetical protein n=1 Tax=Modestobacter sp. Leaf380 TaxID=1736356 RepID=UPI0006FF05BC|nr:hypothetical protein [Modestobacter sp. Leaf380]KQS65764.1 hypothetical protein ASG41_14330 [Modestobacter sp. Leaf380]
MNLQGGRILEYADMHVKAIQLTGGEILGNARDVVDREVHDLFISAKNMNRGTWGYLEIEARAHDHYGRHFGFAEGVAVERPAGLP